MGQQDPTVSPLSAAMAGAGYSADSELADSERRYSTDARRKRTCEPVQSRRRLSQANLPPKKVSEAFARHSRRPANPRQRFAPQIPNAGPRAQRLLLQPLEAGQTCYCFVMLSVASVQTTAESERTAWLAVITERPRHHCGALAVVLCWFSLVQGLPSISPTQTALLCTALLWEVYCRATELLFESNSATPSSLIEVV